MTSIFIKKEALKEHLLKAFNYEQVAEAILDKDLNTLVPFDRMSNHAWCLVNELRNISFSSPLYDVYLKGTVYGLMTDSMDQLINQEIVLEKVVQRYK